MNELSKKIAVALLLILIPFTHIKADCANEEIAELKEKVKEVNITYKYLDTFRNEDDEIEDNRFDVKIKKLPENYYVMINGENVKYIRYDNSEEIVINAMKSGRWEIDIYSDKCSEIIDKINLKLPKYNVYYNDPLCIGIDGNDFAPCGKYYDYDISYEDFKQRVERYRYINKIDEKKSETLEEKNMLDSLLEVINNNIIFVIIGTIAIILIVIIVILVKNKRNRGVLK